MLRFSRLASGACRGPLLPSNTVALDLPGSTNAGVMGHCRGAHPLMAFELQFGERNHLGIFALTLHGLLPLLGRAARSRWSRSPQAAISWSPPFDDLRGESPLRTVGRPTARARWHVNVSPLELQEAAAGSRSPAISLAAHPGLAARPTLQPRPSVARQRLEAGGLGLPADDVPLPEARPMGALPAPCATAAEAKGGEHFGPTTGGEKCAAGRGPAVAQKALTQRTPRQALEVSERSRLVVEQGRITLPRITLQKQAGLSPVDPIKG